MRHIITFILLTAGMAAAGAPYTEPTYNQVERLIGAAGGTSVPSPVYTRPTYSQVERLIKAVKAGGGGCDTNAVDILSNAAVVTNALTVATTNRVSVLEHSKADKSALGDKRDKDDLAVYEVVRTENTDWTLTTNVVDRLATTNGVNAAIEENEKTGTNEQVVRGELWQDYMWLIEVENADFARKALADKEGNNIIDTYATKSEVDDKADRATTLSGYGITNAAPLSMISETNQTFSNAVLAVGLNIDTNSVAVLNDIAAAFGGFPLGAGETATTVGGLLAALAAAIAWLKKNKVQTLKLEDNSVETSADGGVAKLDDFFGNSNSLLNGRLTYERNATGLKDRAFNALTFDGTEYNLSTALSAVTPTASGQPRDLLIVATATAATTISFTAGTIKGDNPTIDGVGKWLITLTEFESGVWYCRQIKIEDAQ